VNNKIVKGDNFYMLPGDMLEIDIDRELDKIIRGQSDQNDIECECGSDAVYKGKAPSHSSWCPKHESL